MERKCTCGTELKPEQKLYCGAECRTAAIQFRYWQKKMKQKKKRGPIVNKLILLALVLSCVGCRSKDRLTNDESGQKLYVVSCCQDNNNGIMTFPSFVPLSHVNLCKKAAIEANKEHGNIDGDLYIPMQTDCGAGFGRIGDQYYVGKGY